MIYGPVRRACSSRVHIFARHRERRADLFLLHRAVPHTSFRVGRSDMGEEKGDVKVGEVRLTLNSRMHIVMHT